jgi:hypothetical protein
LKLRVVQGFCLQGLFLLGNIASALEYLSASFLHIIL